VSDNVPMDGGTAFFADPARGGHIEPYGIVFESSWSNASDSFGQVARRTIRSIVEAGMPVSVKMDTSRGISVGADYDPEVLSELGCTINHEAIQSRAEKAALRGESPPNTPIYNLDGPLGTSLRRILVSVHHMMPVHYYLRKAVQTESVKFSRSKERQEVARLLKYKILMTAVETDRIAEVDAREVSKFGQVWVPCPDNAKALVRSGVDESIVRVVPHPILPAHEARLRSSKRRNKGADEPYTFYNIGKWEPRKNQTTLILAFLRGFKPDEHVRLVLKTSRFARWEGYPETAADALQAALQDPGVRAMGWTGENVANRVILNTSTLPGDEIIRLHGIGDCYVTATHGEGWDMPLFDAMVAGSHLISTRGGGASFYAEDLADLIPCETEVAHRGYNLGHARWLKVDGHRVQEAMVHAYENRSRGKPFRPDFCSPLAVGSLCIRNVLELCDLEGEKLTKFREEAAL